MKPDLFDFIDKHNLHDGIREKVPFFTVWSSKLCFTPGLFCRKIQA